MRLSSLLANAGLPVSAVGPNDPFITAITADSRSVTPGALFVAIPGTAADGRTFIPAAIAQGAAAILAPAGTPVPDASIPLVASENPRHALALIAARLAGAQPEHIVAVTGTNGKTSTAEFLRQIWALDGRSAASLGTLGLNAPVMLPFTVPALTTPDPVALARTLSALATAGVTDVAMEASSHGLDQQRLDGVALSAAGFTNLTRDHLDYHGDLATYRAAKLRLFAELLPERALAAANADMDAETLSAIIEISKERSLDLRLVGERGTTIRLLRQTPLPEGQRLELDVSGMLHDITLALPGRYQADNVLLAASLAFADMERSLAQLPHLTGVRGRMERAALLKNGAAAYVDYAHTPDALARVLDSLRPHATGKLVVVFGAGGDRDRGKRPLMAQEAASHADVVVVTDDNPRSEDPAAIRQDVMQGAPDAIEIGGRADAIAAALDMLRAGDVLVVAGKGHEQGQIIKGVTHPFDDCTVIRELVNP